MKLGCLVSGGKDSLYAAYLCEKRGHSLELFMAMVPDNRESYMFHSHNLHLLERISEICDIPIIFGETMGEKEEELEDLKALIERAKKEYNIQGVCSGAVASKYQKTRVDKICEELGLESIAPFWGRDPEEVLREMLKEGFEAIIVAVAAPPLDEKWLGRTIDEKCVDDLTKLNKKHGIHIMFEGGEAESFVTWCPLYGNKKIIIEDSEKTWDPKARAGSLHIKKIRLADKLLK